MYVYYMYAWYLGGKKTALDHLQLKLQMVVSHYMGVGKGVPLTTEPSCQPPTACFTVHRSYFIT